MSPSRISRTFLGSPASITEARRFITAFLRNWPCVDDAELIVSELATNAVRHSDSGRFGGRFTVSIETRNSWLWLSVLDEGGPRSPRALPPLTSAENGRGLMLVGELSAAWGVTGDDKGRIVWAVLKTLPEAATRR
ncbi:MULTISPECIES: ATP-binding protein [Streptosporangium]|uniref:Anti-sigma regulatory factor (Ser/Thr protein kinase) n=1 Tax=Streptosporangium brasiliense TaxID=47480 RepID=A0ABT9R2A6_9ACTN|nr:ATP-binding protein [Streptosporangium brasiliense]MDP9863364.1 anti-sigma regulatory factor (Ser/Thr protein kinase) [Streptosporangium brasiliense]